MKKIISVVVVLLVGMVIGWLCRPSVTNTVVDIQRDTLVFHDTIRIEKPVYIERTVKDSLLVVVKDTIVKNDTVYVRLPLEKRTYKRDEFYAEVTGYDPRLTYIEVYPKTVVVSKMEIPKEKKNYLAIGVEAGWCIKPYTPIYLEYSRMLHKNIVFNAGVFRDLIREENGMRVGIKAQIGW